MLGQNNTVCRTDMTHSRHTDLTRRRNVMNNLVVAPSFNGRTADSGSAYRGSNPWGAAKSFQQLTVLDSCQNAQKPVVVTFSRNILFVNTLECLWKRRTTCEMNLPEI